MTTGEQDWRGVDEGWGRLASDFAALSEPGNCREYVALHSRLDVRPGERVLDLACGAGLAVELAAARGALVSGIDASGRLVAVARDRSPAADLRVGDMNELPWEDGAFDVVTSFRGIWGTTPRAVSEARRVLRPGGRFGFTVWGDLRDAPGAWTLAPFRLATDAQRAHMSAMVALGRDAAAHELLAGLGFEGIETFDVPFAWDFADPEHFARALASTGPAYEAIQAVGEKAFHEHALALAAGWVREGLPLHVRLPVVGCVAIKPATS